MAALHGTRSVHTSSGDAGSRKRDDDRVHPVDADGSHPHDTAASALSRRVSAPASAKVYLLVCIDKSQTAHVWDCPAATGDENNGHETTGGAGDEVAFGEDGGVLKSGADGAAGSGSARDSQRARMSVVLGAEVSGLIFLPMVTMYAARGHDTVIRINLAHPLSELTYDLPTHSLVVAHPSHITFYTYHLSHRPRIATPAERAAAMLKPARSPGSAGAGGIGGAGAVPPQMNPTSLPAVALTPRVEVKPGWSDDEWITAARVDPKARVVYLVAGTKVAIFSADSGQELASSANVAERNVTCVLFYEGYRYTLFGLTDGTTQSARNAVVVKSFNFALVRTITAHTRAVTALAHYPHGPFVLSAGLDKTVRMISVATFEEVYRINFSEPVCSLTVMDDLMFHVRLFNRVCVYTFNHIASTFASLGSPIRRLSCLKSHGTPRRVLAWTEDGTVRLMSPHARLASDAGVVPARRSEYVKGATLATMFSVVEQERMMDVAYCRVLDRLYVLMEGGEIWCVATDVNPCALADVWGRAGNEQEGLSHLAVFEGKLDMTSFKSSECAPTGGGTFVLLLAGSVAGQVLLLGRGGVVVERFKLHDGKITALHVERKQHLVLTASVDHTVRVLTVDVRSKQVLSPYLTINCGFVPRMVSVMDTILAATDEQIVAMYMVDWNTSTYRFLPGHNRSDDHNDTITSLLALPKISCFVTSSKDGLMKLWDNMSGLVREINFGEPVLSTCCVNPVGDLLVATRSELQLVEYRAYLPPGYLKSVSQMEFKPTMIEQPLAFSEESDFFRLSRQRTESTRLPFGLSKGKDLRSAVDHVQIDRLKERLSRRTSNANESIKPAMSTAGGIAALVCAIENSFDVEKEIARKVALKEQSANKTASNLMRRFLTRKNLGYSQNDSNTSFSRGTINSSSGSDAVVFIPVTSSAVMLDSPVENDTFGAPSWSTLAIDGGPDTTTKHEQDEIVILDQDVPVAPDGELPNSNPIQGLIDKWCLAHNITIHRPLRTKSQAESRSTPLPLTTHSRSDTLQKQNEYQERIRRMLNKAKQQEEANRQQELETKITLGDFEDESSDSSPPDELIAVQPIEETPQIRLQQEESLDDLERFQKGLREQILQNEPKTEPSSPPPDPPVVEEKTTREPSVQAPPPPAMPKILEQSFKYSWFPQDDVFYPVEDTIHAALGKKSTTKFKIDPEPDALQHMLVKLFNSKATSHKTRKEIVEYHLWIHKETGFRDINLALNTYITYLQVFSLTPKTDHTDPDEVMVCISIIEAIAHFGREHYETIPLALHLTQSRVEVVRKRSLQLLRYLGVTHPQDSLLQSRIARIVGKVQVTHAITGENEKSVKPNGHGIVEQKQAPFTHSNSPSRMETSQQSGTTANQVQSLSQDVNQSVKDVSRVQLSETEPLHSFAASPIRQALLEWLRGQLKNLLMSILNDVLTQSTHESNESALAEQKLLELSKVDSWGNSSKERQIVTRAGIQRKTGRTKLSTEIEELPNQSLSDSFKSSDSLLNNMLAPFEPAPTTLEVEGERPTNPSTESGARSVSRWKRAIKISGGNRLATVVQDAMQKKRARRHSSNQSLSKEALTGGAVPEHTQKLPPLDIDVGDTFGPPLAPTGESIRISDPIHVLTSPTAEDFVASINWYISHGLRKIAAAEQARHNILHEQDKQRREKEEAAKALAKMKEYAAIKAAEKKALAFEEERKRRKRVAAPIHYQKASALVSDEEIASLAGHGNLEKFVTHRSVCHEGREVTDYPLESFPSVIDTRFSRPHATIVSLHLKALQHSLPRAKGDDSIVDGTDVTEAVVATTRRWFLPGQAAVLK
ncbi:hypothetical protein M427DRAFT_141963 [Gonapodya prolifera JEL478]|uniref:WD40 repeat-like protein n=1 Tax=Gonapodya prolifera (strain JEL478) TaxID=1344416 RepID=A0A139B1E3_GONPJ|nr:hypothetical protein M427DRAFT_141963 [Gonapodya prolifera JEL478]|eukprot:KXS22555.1 hypothetical protein M427DRAFT_141963 [Gonapodya prolifera JEL478]